MAISRTCGAALRLKKLRLSVSKIAIQQASNVPSSVDERNQVLLFVIFV
jgi:hypothetical protein